MARMEFSGVNDMMEQLFKESERLERKATEMLGKAGEVVVKAWKDTITAHGHVKTGAMRDNVRASKVNKSGDAYITTIYPHGRDANKTRNAEKAFVLHYGRSNLKGDGFVDEAEEKAKDAAEAIMEEVWQSD